MPTLRHPALPADQTITVGDRAAEFWSRCGWIDAEASAAPPVPPAEPVKPEPTDTSLDLTKEN